MRIIYQSIQDSHFGRRGKEEAKIDKSMVHGSGFRGINYNLDGLAAQLHLHLAVIDGFDGD